MLAFVLSRLPVVVSFGKAQKKGVTKKEVKLQRAQGECLGTGSR